MARDEYGLVECKRCNHWDAKGPNRIDRQWCMCWMPLRHVGQCIHAAAVEEMRCRVGARRGYDMARAALAERNIFIRSWP
jgi:hypothetical protein